MSNLSCTNQLISTEHEWFIIPPAAKESCVECRVSWLPYLQRWQVHPRVNLQCGNRFWLCACYWADFGQSGTGSDRAQNRLCKSWSGKLKGSTLLSTLNLFVKFSIWGTSKSSIKKKGVMHSESIERMDSACFIFEALGSCGFGSWCRN